MDEPDLSSVISSLRRLTAYVERTTGLRSDTVADASPVLGRARGPLQQAIADLPGMMDAAGLASGEIAAQVQCLVPNIYRLLRALCESGVVEPVPGSGPQRWRLSAAHRSSPAVFERFARTVGPGEWTSCADLSIAARGDLFGARLVCWAAGHAAGFPDAHRVLLEGGIPHPVAHEHQRASPAEVRALLLHEGLAFTAGGRASPARRVPWDQLRDRARQGTGSEAPNGRQVVPRQVVRNGRQVVPNAQPSR
jgi:hypothetical protein